MKVYISGKISGLSADESFDKFCGAEIYLVRGGHEAVNPRRQLRSLALSNTPYREIMELCLTMLKYCDAIYMLDNWNDSPGAKAEKAYAEALGLEIMYEGKYGKDTEKDIEA